MSSLTDRPSPIRPLPSGRFVLIPPGVRDSDRNDETGSGYPDDTTPTGNYHEVTSSGPSPRRSPTGRYSSGWTVPGRREVPSHRQAGGRVSVSYPSGLRSLRSTPSVPVHVDGSQGRYPSRMRDLAW